MKLNQITKLVLATFVVATNLVINQGLVNANEQNQSDIANLFNLAAKQHKRELHELRATRRALPIYLPNVTSESVAKVLSVRSIPTDSEAGYPDKSAVLFYSFDKDQLQVWLVNQNGIQAYHKRKISVNQINEAITNFRNSLGVDSLQLARTPRRAIIKISKVYNQKNLPLNRTKAELTKILLPAPIKEKLTSVRHLIITPVLGLGTVPYALLQPFKDNSYLIDKMSISITSSLFDLDARIDRWNRNAFSSPLIVGNPYLTPSTGWVVPPLSGAEKEALAVAKQLNTTPLIGKEASKKKIVSRMPSSSLIYFATHGIANNDNPLIGSFLMLSSETFEQGWLTAEEVKNFNLRGTKIAILSACQTGLGKIHKAGIIGLARGFQKAGVPRVVMSLWSVDDAATNKLMQVFVKHLKDNIPAEALRKAMIETKEQGYTSSQWGAFTLFGTPR